MPFRCSGSLDKKPWGGGAWKLWGLTSAFEAGVQGAGGGSFLADLQPVLVTNLESFLCGCYLVRLINQPLMLTLKT